MISHDKKAINNGRQFEVDVVKFFAIPFMICIHFYEQFGEFDFVNVLPDTIFRNIIEFIGGPLAAPVFMFCMGIGMIYTRHVAPSDFMKRGLKLLMTGYLLNFFRQTLPQLIGKLMGVETDLDIIGGLLNVDILPFAGMAFLAIGLMRKGNLSSLVICVLSFLMQGAGIWATKIDMAPGVGQNLVGLLIPTGKWTSFSMTLWLVYPAMGMVFAEYLMRVKDKRRMYGKLTIASASLMIAFTSGLIFTGFDMRMIYALYHDSYYHHTIIATMWITPLIFIALGISYFLFAGVEEKRIGSVIKFCSINLNSIYIIQWLIIAYAVALGVLIDIKKTESPVVIILGRVVVLVVSILIDVIYIRLRRKVKTWKSTERSCPKQQSEHGHGEQA